MSKFRVPVVRIDRIEDHPTASHMTINYFYDRYIDEDNVPQSIEYQTVSSRLDDGSPRYKHGDAAVFHPHNSILEEDYIRHIGYVDENGKSLFKSGRVKAGNFQKVRSDGILTHCTSSYSESGAHISDAFVLGDETTVNVKVGDDLKDILRITEYQSK